MCMHSENCIKQTPKRERNFSYLHLAFLWSLTLQLMWIFRYQRSTSAISVGKLNLLLCPREFQVNCSTDHYDRSEHCFAYAVAPVYYAHLAAAQVRQFVKLDESSETGSSASWMTASGPPCSSAELGVDDPMKLHEDSRQIDLGFCFPWTNFAFAFINSEGWTMLLSLDLDASACYHQLV